MIGYYLIVAVMLASVSVIGIMDLLDRRAQRRDHR